MFVCASAVAPQKQVFITFPNDTPASELDVQKERITSAVSHQSLPRALLADCLKGGEIVHEYHLIKGFIVKTTEEALESMTALLQSLDKYKPIIEDDSIVTTQG